MERSIESDWPAVPLGLDLSFSGAEGAYLVMSDGRRILDAAGQACVNNIGYGRAEVAEVAARAMRECTHVLPIFATPQRERLVRRLRDRWLPRELTRIHLLNSGSEAADTAIKLARQYHVHTGNPGKWKVIGRRPSYHGITLGALAVGRHHSRRSGFEPQLPDFPTVSACYPLRCPHCAVGGGCDLACARELETRILSEGPDTVAAFMAEVVTGTSGGALVPTEGYWDEIRAICDRYGVLVIVDEVITGFGRTGRRFAVDHWGVRADIMTAAKGISGGYVPLAALFTTDRIALPLMDAGDTIMFHTFGGNPAACAVADKVLEILEDEHLVDRARDLGQRLGEGLATLEDHPHVAEVRGMGMLWAVEIVRDRDSLVPFEGKDNMTMRVVLEGLKRGVFYYMGGTGEFRDIVCLGPPFVLDHSEVDTMVEVLREAIDAATGSTQRRGA